MELANICQTIQVCKYQRY